METKAESLSAVASPAATHRSPEEQDLLERSTKKAKRGREAIESPLPLHAADYSQETPIVAGASTPDSQQWRTPDATPNQAWTRREEGRLPDKDLVSDDDAMDEASTNSWFPVIQVTKEEKERLRRPWRRSLIIKVLGRTVGYSYLLQRLQHMWKPESTFDLIALAQDYYIAKFQLLADYDAAKFGGPWIILGHYLVVQEWEPNFIPSKNKTKKLLVWVRFPELPIEYFDEEFLKKIGKTIGRPVKIDTTTSLASIGKFARVCVEIDITKSLLSKFVLHFMDWPIKYEGINLICFKCGVYDHHQENCGKEGDEGGVNSGQNAVTADMATPPVEKQKPPERFGAWMLVTRKERRRRARTNVQPGTFATGAGDQTATINVPTFEGI
ncbi:PREDICTED: uncharacterized protein LOC109156274 [Ipomoea nil]|uniref:uncharacterized protein LOC109156274 n=1 Tax=Ipomoea nil TaxID=35883 RepID=UPI0009012DAB|nr:PREDICTED: uncharacterized protein LOC109156274 [Ipomoea nil]